MDRSFDDTYFITADADYLPLVENLFVLPKHFEILLTSPLVNPINPKSEFIFNEKHWNKHGWMNAKHNSKSGYSTVEYLELKKLVSKRSSSEDELIHKHLNPNYQILRVGVINDH